MKRRTYRRRRHRTALARTFWAFDRDCGPHIRALAVDAPRFRRRRPDAKSEELVLLCAAGPLKPVQEICTEYERQYGVKVDIEADNSGRLLSRLRVAAPTGRSLFGQRRIVHVRCPARKARRRGPARRPSARGGRRRQGESAQDPLAGRSAGWRSAKRRPARCACQSQASGGFRERRAGASRGPADGRPSWTASAARPASPRWAM